LTDAADPEKESLRLKFPGSYIRAIVLAREEFTLREIPKKDAQGHSVRDARGRLIFDCPFEIPSSDAIVTELDDIYIVELVGNSRCPRTAGRRLGRWELRKHPIQVVREHRFWPKDETRP